MNADTYVACAKKLAERAKDEAQLLRSIEQLYSCVVRDARKAIQSRTMRNAILEQIREEILEVV